MVYGVLVGDGVGASLSLRLSLRRFDQSGTKAKRPKQQRDERKENNKCQQETKC